MPCEECADLTERMHAIEEDADELRARTAAIETVITSLGTVALTLHTVPPTHDE